MKKHCLKIKAEYAKAKLEGKKPFEIRIDDGRDFAVGDLVEYQVPDDEKLNQEIRGKVFVITYVTRFEQKPGYVVFGEKKVEEDTDFAVTLKKAMFVDIFAEVAEKAKKHWPHSPTVRNTLERIFDEVFDKMFNRKSAGEK